MELVEQSPLTSCAWRGRAAGAAGLAVSTAAEASILIGWCDVWARRWWCPACFARPSRCEAAPLCQCRKRRRLSGRDEDAQQDKVQLASVILANVPLPLSRKLPPSFLSIKIHPKHWNSRWIKFATKDNTVTDWYLTGHYLNFGKPQSPCTTTTSELIPAFWKRSDSYLHMNKYLHIPAHAAFKCPSSHSSCISAIPQMFHSLRLSV